MRTKKIAALLPGLGLGLFLVGCGDTPTETPPATTSNPPAASSSAKPAETPAAKPADADAPPIEGPAGETKAP